MGLRRLRKKTLRWSKGCPEFHAKAADSWVFLEYVCAKLQRQPLQGPYNGLLAVVWAADQLSRCVMKADTFLCEHEKRHVTVIGGMFLSGYAALAWQAHVRGEKYFKMRPKYHYLQHMIECERPSRRNPAWDHCYVDEDHVKHCIRMLRKVSHRTAERHLLKRNMGQVKQTMLKRLGR